MKPIDALKWGPKYEYVQLKDGSYVIRVTPGALLGTKPVLVDLTADQYQRFLEWRNTGALIQDVLSDLPRSEREKLISGVAE